MKKMNLSSTTAIFAVMLADICIMGCLIMQVKILLGALSFFGIGIIIYQMSGGPQAFRKYNKKLRW